MTLASASGINGALEANDLSYKELILHLLMLDLIHDTLVVNGRIFRKKQE